MPDIEPLKAEIKKLSAKAINMKMNLHDLAEDLPVNWTTIMTVAQQTYDAYRALEGRARRSRTRKPRRPEFLLAAAAAGRAHSAKVDTGFASDCALNSRSGALSGRPTGLHSA